MRPPSGRNSPQRCPLTLRWSAWVSTSLRWATAHARCLAKMGGCNFRALMAEKRAKETSDSPAKRLEITAAMPSNFALVRPAPRCSARPARSSPHSSSLPSEKFVSKLYHRKQLKFARICFFSRALLLKKP